MRNGSGLTAWLRGRWLELLLILGLIGLILWYVRVGMSFMPTPASTPTPTATRALAVAASRAPGGVNTQNRVLPTPTATKILSPTVTPRTPAPADTKSIRMVAPDFDGRKAYDHVLAQTEIGPRPSGSEASKRTQDYIATKLKEYGWQIENQAFEYKDTPCLNIIGRAGQGPVVILIAHYDTRRLADNDPDPAKRDQPVMGADDGASGVAVLLELARALDKSKLPYQVWLAFVDAEDNGGLAGWDFLAGSRYMAQHLQVRPEYVIVADMIGDADQQIYKEYNSTAALQNRIWGVAQILGYEQYFKPDYKYSMVDDHTPFLELGLPAQDLIDFDYPYWHTTQDTADKVSPEALERVGRVLKAFIQESQQ